MSRRNGGAETLGRESAPSLRKLADANVPSTKDGLATLVTRALAEGVENATTAKELAELAKVGTEWYKVLHPADPSGGYGGKLGERDG